MQSLLQSPRHRLKDVSNFTALLNLQQKLHLISIAMKSPRATNASLVLRTSTRRLQRRVDDY